MPIGPIDFGVNVMNPGSLPTQRPGSDPFQGILDTILQAAIGQGMRDNFMATDAEDEGFVPDFIFDPNDPITSALFGGTEIDEYR